MCFDDKGLRASPRDLRFPVLKNECNVDNREVNKLVNGARVKEIIVYDCSKKYSQFILSEVGIIYSQSSEWFDA